MKKLVNEIFDELRTVLKGKTLDVLIPPIAFAILNGQFSLWVATGTASLLALLLGLHRYRQGTVIYYALGGFIGVLVASAFALLQDNASDFFIPDIVGSALFIVTAIVSLVFRRPMAAWVSHIVRGWTKEWFWRDDVRPAYSEVTIFWAVMVSIRLAVEVYLYLYADASALAVWNIFLGLPATIAVLIVTYIYGIFRLHTLRGPGIEEYDRGDEPPYKGQTRGF
ncbi:MAG: DUF3159 domain-containing protein [Candidatus Izemoplasmataceae bacterium]